MKGDKGQIISGSYGDLLIRQKSDSDLEIGELLVAENKNEKILLQVHDIFYGSQISQLNLEKISGYNLEDDKNHSFINNNLRNYKLAKVKALLNLSGKNVKSSKNLPDFFSCVRAVKEEDLEFLSQTKNKLLLGNLRSGTKSLNLPVYLDGEKVLSHHILITGTTGRGKSVLMKNLIWNVTKEDYGAILVFDPHDEYYGRKTPGMKDYPDKNKVVYYTSKDVPSGQRSLKLNLELLRPDHFDFMSLSGPQKQALYLYYKKFKKSWIKKIFTEEITSDMINEMTLAVLKRRLSLLLDIDSDGTNIYCSGIFDETSGTTLISDVVSILESGKTVIVDTSNFSGSVELLVASMITAEVFNKYKRLNSKGELASKPVINIVLEEAPRVIGKDVLEHGSNIFSTIAREGRKFKIGLSAITQLPSLIPKEVLANLNTKIILGTEMNSERQAIIESASQDLSTDNRNIASLDKGEAIVSSNFARLPLPVAIPFFDEMITKKKSTEKNSFSGIKME